jgi:hypothetical protein
MTCRNRSQPRRISDQAFRHTSGNIEDQIDGTFGGRFTELPCDITMTASSTMSRMLNESLSGVIPPPSALENNKMSSRIVVRLSADREQVVNHSVWISQERPLRRRSAPPVHESNHATIPQRCNSHHRWHFRFCSTPVGIEIENHRCVAR